ncbi:Sec-independent protein translocase protein TatB [Metapseudomonas otitidis]|uniref:Sec-independent protein translocase protein TatB n=1 Tax=Metapseudomonas otitidis TaxID=319939 RepID=UPI0020977240|nr:Sec-independent protein translocase protein TatB [Pseudomonas otitidis]MCO7553403.1 Sec-independent protein translocase protein TatB [Pseudomonas otitidis]
MFGISFGELLLIGLVALLVLGPERLPGAARTAGLWIGRLKRSFNAIKQEVEREIGADEIRRQLHNEQIMAMERQIKESIVPPSLENLLTDPAQRDEAAEASPTPAAPQPAPAPAPAASAPPSPAAQPVPGTTPAASGATVAAPLASPLAATPPSAEPPQPPRPL